MGAEENTFTPILLSQGNSYNVTFPTYYVESDEDLENIANAPVPSIAIVNEAGNFHKVMLDSQGNWNMIEGSSNSGQK